LQLHFSGDIHNVLPGIELLSKELGVHISDNGFPIQVYQHNMDEIIVECDGKKGLIHFKQPIHFFRALGLWLQEFRSKKEFKLTEKPQFTSNGVMVDASRNAVMTVEGIQTLLRKMALMGLNLVMMYTEDTFTVKKYPYFGYMRGRYSKEELAKCDRYAQTLGIEMIPCIQTLAHLTVALKWNYASSIKDTSDILLAGSEETYEFVNELLKAASEPFKSNRIHIGMDEAHMLGLGRYLDLNGYQKRFEIMNNHLQKVVALAEEIGLEPMIWSDMYFRLGSKTGNYYDLGAEIPEDVVSSIPKNVQLVYWDYYHDDEEFYQSFIKKHKGFGSNPVFAGGAWTWNGIAPNYGKTFLTTNAALNACKKEGIKEVFATLWGDNGAETPFFSMLAGLQLFAEHGYAKSVDETKLAKRFEFCVGTNIDDFLLLNAFDETPGVGKGNMKESHPSKFLLWQDILIGLYDENIKNLSMNEHYTKLATKLEQVTIQNPEWKVLFNFYFKLARVLSVKAEFGLQLKAAYDASNQEELAKLKHQLPILKQLVEELRLAHRDVWFSVNKPFGWEVLDIRYGGVLSRIESTEYRLQEYLNGNVDKIEELAEERLYHDAPWVMPEGALGRNSYHRIVTAGTFSS